VLRVIASAGHVGCLSRLTDDNGLFATLFAALFSRVRHCLASTHPFFLFLFWLFHHYKHKRAERAAHQELTALLSQFPKPSTRKSLSRGRSADSTSRTKYEGSLGTSRLSSPPRMISLPQKTLLLLRRLRQSACCVGCWLRLTLPSACEIWPLPFPMPTVAQPRPLSAIYSALKASFYAIGAAA
jgi:hypothetical protein